MCIINTIAHRLCGYKIMHIVEEEFSLGLNILPLHIETTPINDDYYLLIWNERKISLCIYLIRREREKVESDQM
jgi:hypothetical protein